MKQHDSSRRDFLQQSAALAGSSWAKLIVPGIATLSQAACTAKEEQAAFTILSNDEATEFAAIAARILPTTDTPGAKEAGVIYFFDQSFGTFNAPMLEMSRAGLAQLQLGIDGDVRFSELSEDEQDLHLEAIEQTPFFGVMRLLTLFGFFGMSKHGGNKDDIGWKLVGIDPHVHSFESPFGYYDAEYMKENPSG